MSGVLDYQTAVLTFRTSAGPQTGSVAQGKLSPHSRVILANRMLLQTIGLARTADATFLLTHLPSEALPTSLPWSTITLPRRIVITG